MVLPAGEFVSCPPERKIIVSMLPILEHGQKLSAPS
jgi:hypothetical protein